MFRLAVEILPASGGMINCLWNAVFLGADLGERLNGAPGRTRTCYLPLRRGTLYPDELQGQYREKGGMIAAEGLWLKVRSFLWLWS